MSKKSDPPGKKPRITKDDQTLWQRYGRLVTPIGDDGKPMKKKVATGKPDQKAENMMRQAISKQQDGHDRAAARSHTSPKAGLDESHLERLRDLGSYQTGRAVLHGHSPDYHGHDSPFAKGLDRRTRQKLRRGHLEIEGRLDLHGYNQEQAHSALIRFVEHAYAAGKRCLLVITGKGLLSIEREESRGVLRRKLPQWVKDAPLNHMVLDCQIAQVKDGGGGAYYLLIRRKKA